MAMPPHRSLLLVAVFVVSAAQAVAGTDGNIVKVCSGMMFSEVCEETLTSMPGSSTATPRRAAELAFQNVLKEGTTLSSEMDKALAAPKEPGNVDCLKTADMNLKNYVADVAKAPAPEKDFDGTRDLFNKMLYNPSGTHSCSNVNEPVIEKVLTYESKLQVTADLFNKASPPSPPPPPE